MVRRSAGAGLVVALCSAATFATSGPFAKSLLEAGWTPGSVVFLRIAGAALLLAVPTVRALEGRWGDLAHQWRRVAVYGLAAVALPQVAFFYAVQHLSVGVALLLEYLALVLVVAWQAVVARRLPGRGTWLGIALAVVGLVLVLDVFGGVHVDGIGVLWGLLAALGLTSYFVASGHAADDALPPIALAGSGLACAAVGFGLLGALGVLPMSFPADDVVLGRRAFPWWVAVAELALFAAAIAYVSGIVATRLLGPTVASFVGLCEVLFAVLFAWLLLGELPRPVQLLGGVFIVAGVVAVRTERPVVSSGDGSEAEHGPALVTTPLGEVAEVPHDGVELARVDVAAT